MNKKSVGRPPKNKPMKSVKIYEETLNKLKTIKSKHENTKIPIVVLIDEAVDEIQNAIKIKYDNELARIYNESRDI